MPAEQEEQARQVEALRRYVSNLGVKGDQQAAFRRVPSWRALLAVEVVAAIALSAGILVATIVRPGGPARSAGPATPGVVVVGDSLATVTAPAGPDVAFPLVAARLLGWRAVLDARPDSGFAAPARPNPRYRTFGGAVGGVAARDPRVVVVALGSDDAAEADPARVIQSAATVQTAATGALAELHRRLPRARVVVVGPVPSGGAPPPAVQAVGDAVRAAARAARVPFIDPLAERWITGDRADRWSGNAAQMIGADGRHLTPAGHAYVGLRLATDLSRLKVASP